MKMHITNSYHYHGNSDISLLQQQFATAGRELGFFEMGIYCYPVATDTPGELSRRLDGIIASLEYEDVVFMQLPSGNGYAYESLLFHKIKAYRNTKLVLVIHDIDIIQTTADYMSLCEQSDAVIIPSSTMSGLFRSHNIKHLLFYNTITTAGLIREESNADNTIIAGTLSLCQTNFYVKKILMDAIETVFSDSISSVQILQHAKEEEIQIAFGLHDKNGYYSVWVGTAMQSVMEHTTSKICFHIMHDDTLTESNKNRLIQTANAFQQRIIFHPIDVEHFSAVKKRVKGYSIASMFRILLPDLLPEMEKIIYLDADILAARDIKELWETNISEHCLAAVPDMLTSHHEAYSIPIQKKEILPEQYFNSGILYLNLNKIRERGDLLNATLDYIERTPETDLLDQDALNYVFRDSTLLLDESWNYWASFVRKNKETKLANKIYHYVGTRLHLFYHTEMDQLYYETICRTPWGLEEGREHLISSLTRITDSTNCREQLISQLTTPKKFIFYGEEDWSMKYFYQMVEPREGDYRILINHENDRGKRLPCQNFSKLLEEERGTYLVFVSPLADSHTSLETLEQHGLKKGTDYFNILQLLLPDKGGYM